MLFGSATVAGQSGDWKEYIYVQDGFAILAPDKVNFERQTFASDQGNVETHIYSITAGEENVFALLLFIRPSKDRRSAQQVLDQARESAVGEGNNGRLVSQKAVALGSYPGLELELEYRYPESGAKNHHSRNRYFVVGNRLYRLMSIAPAGLPLSAETDRWFKSFRLVSP